MLKVAITGNIASGKTAVENILKSRGFKVIDADEISHQIIKEEEIKTQIIDAFYGTDILEGQDISRPKLGQIVFKDESSRKKLERILHPKIKQSINNFFEQQENAGKKIAFASIPLLFEANFEEMFDKIILIFASDNLRLERLMKRNNLPIEFAQNRLAIQMSQDEKIQLCDYVIYNNDDLSSLEKNIDEMIDSLRF